MKALECSDLVMGIDVGTESLRVGVFNLLGELVSSAVNDYPSHYPYVGWAEQEPRHWWQALVKSIREACQGLDVERVRALTLCATSSTVLAMDDSGNPLGPAIMWMDSRATREAEEINLKPDQILQYSGGQVSVEWMIPKVLWLRNHRPEMYRQAAAVLEALDWLNYRLTGRLVASKCSATCKWNYADIVGGWSKEFFEAIGLADFSQKCPTEVVPVGEPIGSLLESAALELGLPRQVLVIQGGIDAHIGMLGMGVTRPGRLGLIMGSSFVHLALSKEPIFHRGLWGPYPNAVVPGLWLIEGGQISAGSITRWFRDQFCRDLLSDPQAVGSAYVRLVEEAERIPAGSEGLVVLDFWQGNRTPYRDPFLTGTIFGLTLKHSRGHVFRGILEGVSYGSRNILEAFEQGGYRADEIVASGGGTKNHLWVQIMADVNQKPVILTEFGNAGILGGAIAAAFGINAYKSLDESGRCMTRTRRVIEPNPANKEIYSFLFEKYQKSSELLAEMMREIRGFTETWRRVSIG